MSIVRPPMATYLYPRFKTPTFTIDLPIPASRIPSVPSVQGLRGENRVATGKSEFLFGRLEHQVGLVLRCEQDTLAAVSYTHLTLPTNREV